MSKSKKNTVDPDDIIASYGADTARWFMLSDSPPERDVIWTEDGVQGAWRFVQRLWRLVQRSRRDRPRPRRRRARRPSARRRSRSARPPTARSRKVSDDIERLRFNVCVAHIYEFANALPGARSPASKREPTRTTSPGRSREAVDILVRLFHPMMPHLAEECWAALGHKTLVAAEALAAARAGLAGRKHRSLLPVQINGKKRADVTVARDAAKTDIEAAVLALDAVKRALDGKAARRRSSWCRRGS